MIIVSLWLTSILTFLFVATSIGTFFLKLWEQSKFLEIFLKCWTNVSLSDHRSGPEGLGFPRELGDAQHQREEETEVGEDHQAGEQHGGGRGGGILGRREWTVRSIHQQQLQEKHTFHQIDNHSLSRTSDLPSLKKSRVDMCGYCVWPGSRILSNMRMT